MKDLDLRLLLILSVCYFFTHTAFTQKRTLSRQVVFEKMGRQSANVLLEDSYGFIWVGAGTLYRYDGSDIKPYKLFVNDSSSISPGGVHSLLEDSQKRIWVGGSKGLFQYDRESDLFIRRFIDKPVFNENLDPILSLFEDRFGRLWVGDKQHIYVAPDPDKDQFKIIEGIELGTKPQGALGITAITKIEGKIIATSTNGLWVINEDFSVQQFLPEKWRGRMEEFQILDAVTDSEEMLWLATTDGLWKFDIKEQIFIEKEIPPYVGKVILSLLMGKENELWLGLQGSGLLRLKNGHFDHFSHDSDNSYSLLDNRVRALMSDRFNNLWIGTLFGVNKVNFEQQVFPFYQIDPGPFNRDNYTFRVLEDSLGGFWFRFIRQGLGYSAGLGKEAQILFNPNPNSSIEEIKNFCVDPDGSVWVITLTNGLYKFDKGKSEKQYIDLGDSMRVAYCFSILSDNTDERYLWFSGKFGLCRVNRHDFSYKWFSPVQDLPNIDNSGISGFIQTEDGNIWFNGRFKEGRRVFIYFDRKKEKFVAELSPKGQSTPHHFSRITYYQAIPGNKIWHRVDDGLGIIDANSNTYMRISTKDGFPVKNLCNVIADRKGNIWFTGTYKVCKYDGTNYECYDARRDIERFIKNSATIGKDGRITFGGVNGIYSFYPDSIKFKRDTIPPTVHLSNFKVFNKNRRLGRAHELAKKITLPYNDNIFSLEFSALHFLHSETFRYKHKLHPFEKEWVETGSDERQATYTNLSPGKYTFKVIAANSDGVWTPDNQALEIAIIVLPPWYLTWWAYALWTLLLLISLFLIYHFQLIRRLQRAENKRLKELDQLKTQLYTNITHEFRTPLTVIEGMNRKIVEKPEKWMKSGTDMIGRSARHLLSLVNQMLDLSKLESGRLELKAIQGDAISYICYVLESFESLAQTKNIQMHILPRVDALVMDYDPDRLIDVISNLLSNAIKFTPEGGDIYVFIDQKELGINGNQLKVSNWKPAMNSQLLTPHCLLLTIKDTGAGIEPEQLPHIFDRFYQGDSSITRKNEGTGIGLALTKELVNLMGGEIVVESAIGKGSEFTILLPIQRNAPVAKPQRYTKKKSSFKHGVTNPDLDIHPTANSQDDSFPQILIIEDNTDVISYLVSCLEEDYQLEVASNGEEGIAAALKSVPDLIISDVMMPEKDGFEVCKTLKEDTITSHIPIILLTAKADLDSKIEGLQMGADAYLLKPFHEKELHLRLNNLLELRKKIQTNYRLFEGEEGITSKSEEALPDIEDKFLQELREIIEAHLTDKELNVTKLCKLAGMSRTQLHRKLVALTGKATTKFIRSVKLSKAVELLKTTDLRISDIAYATGFGNANWFTRAFSEDYEMSPTEFREKYQE